MEVRNGVREFGSWSEQKSSSGKRYYYNKDTEVSQWDKPDEWKEWERVQEAAANTRVPPPPLPPMPPPPPHHNTSVPPPPITMPSMHFMQQPPPNYAHSAHQAAAFVPSQQTQSFNAAQVAAAAAAFHNAMPIGFHHHQPPPNITQPPPTQHTPVQQHPFVQMSTSVPPPPSPMFAGKPTTTTMSATFSHHNTPTRSSSQTTSRHMYGQHGGNSAHHTPSSHYDRAATATRQDSSEVKMDIDNDSNSDRATPKAAAPVRVAKRDSQNEERERPAKMARTAEPSPPVHRRSSVSPALSNGPPAPTKTDSPVQPQQHDWMRFYSKELSEKAKPPGDDIQQKLVDYGLNDVKLHLELGKQLVDLKGIRALVQTAQMRVILNDRKLVHLAEAQRTLETKMREHSAGALNIPFSTSNTA